MFCLLFDSFTRSVNLTYVTATQIMKIIFFYITACNKSTDYTTYQIIDKTKTKHKAFHVVTGHRFGLHYFTGRYRSLRLQH